MSHRILIVEDEKTLRDHLEQTFAAESFSIFTCVSMTELEAMLELPIRSFDVIVLDRLLHGRDAGPYVPRIKSALLGAKIMILSAINTPTEKATLLDYGADDYLAKPFASEELVARVRALLRRSVAVARIGNVFLNIEDRKLFIADKELQLTNKEFLFLKALVQSPGKIFSKSYLYQNVWDMSPDVESNVVETTVSKLRRRFEELGATAEIRNARNVGYWIEE